MNKLPFAFVALCLGVARAETDGWVPLFDGKTSAGWVSVTNLTAFPSCGWEIRDGALSVVPTRHFLPDGNAVPTNGGQRAQGGDICTVRRFRDFHFKAEFRLTPQANGGFKYFYEPDRNGGTALEYQVLDPDYPTPPGTTAESFATKRVASAYLLYAADAEKYLKPCGEWNQAEIIACGRTVEHWLNGVKVVSFTRGSADFWKRFATTKWANAKCNANGDWGCAGTGRIQLQNHQDAVSYRNLMIREFPSVVGEPFLGRDAENYSQSILFSEVAALDTAADDAWRDVRTAAEYARKRRDLREKMMTAIGPLPERTPLKTRVVETVRRPGYRLEKIVFESRPGLFVPAYRTFPESPKFKAPYPGVVIACGHNASGKAADGHLHAAVLAAEHGFAAIVYDPVEQGERRSAVARKAGPCVAHNFLGVKAVLVGQSLAAIRIWDGIRAIDCLLESPEVDAPRLAFMGNSGGGTMTAYMMCADGRIRAAAPACYLTNLREVCDHKGPQDAEQNIYGQLKVGLNHAGFVLIPDIPVLMATRVNDNFSFHGSLDTFSVARGLLQRLGKDGRVALISDPGPHGWTESNRLASLDWFRAWLCGERNLLPLDAPQYRLNSLAYTDRMTDSELAISKRDVVGGDALALKGATDPHALLAAECDRLAAMRARLSLGEKRTRAAALAGVRLPAEAKVLSKELGRDETNGVRWTRLAFQHPGGLVLPAVLLEPRSGATQPPVLMAGIGGREQFAERAFAAAKGGAPVLVADLTGCGEIGAKRYPHYGNRAYPEEGMSWQLHLMGESMVGRRATDILVLAANLEKRFGRVPDGLFGGTLAVAAAHAVAACPERFGKLALEHPPTSWATAMHAADPEDAGLTWSVNGALKYYDWVELIAEAIINLENK